MADEADDGDLTVADAIEQYAEATDQQLFDVVRYHLRKKTRDETTTRALHSPELAERTLLAVERLLRNVGADIEAVVGDDEDAVERRRRTRYFQNVVGVERQIVVGIVGEVRRQRGFSSSAPNPRGRAFRRLADRHPVEYLELLREEQDADKAKAKARRAEAKAVRRAERAVGADG